MIQLIWTVTSWNRTEKVCDNNYRSHVFFLVFPVVTQPLLLPFTYYLHFPPQCCNCLSPCTSFTSCPPPSFTHTNFEERGADKRLFLVDGSRAEDVARPQVQRDVLNHVSQELEVVNVADKIHAFHLREADEYVLREREKGREREISHKVCQRMRLWRECDKSKWWVHALVQSLPLNRPTFQVW